MPLSSHPDKLRWVTSALKVKTISLEQYPKARQKLRHDIGKEEK
jgi:hypothetical protein